VPSKDEHLEKAEGNEGVADSIQPTSQARIEWKLVIMFYAAMHYVEAYLDIAMMTHLRSHTTRDSWMAREANLRKVATPYNHLKFYGYNARYEVTTFTTQDINDAMGYLAHIRTELEPYLK
jgi:hypothetical protein